MIDQHVSGWEVEQPSWPDDPETCEAARRYGNPPRARNWIVYSHRSHATDRLRFLYEIEAQEIQRLEALPGRRNETLIWARRIATRFLWSSRLQSALRASYSHGCGTTTPTTNNQTTKAHGASWDCYQVSSPQELSVGPTSIYCGTKSHLANDLVRWPQTVE